MTVVTKTPSIWVVDDDPSVGPALRRMVRALDTDCLLLTSGADLLARIEATRTESTPTDGTLPTFILLDIHMPRVSGLDALRTLRARGIDLPVVMMTGVERDGIRASCLAAGAAAVLAKPVDARTIMALLDRFAATAPAAPVAAQTLPPAPGPAPRQAPR